MKTVEDPGEVPVARTVYHPKKEIVNRSRYHRPVYSLNSSLPSDATTSTLVVEIKDNLYNFKQLVAITISPVLDR